MDSLSKRPADNGAVKVTREDWLALALKTLVTKGIDFVLILPLAKKLKVSRSSFYWYFKNRQELLDLLLAHWMQTNTQAIVDHANRQSETITRGVLNVFECWVDDDIYSPRLDFAVRNWARQSKTVRKLIEMADNDRLQAIKEMYERHGYCAEDALIRARVLYFMQIGYYVLDVKEPMHERLSHIEAYLRAFTGLEPAADEMRSFQIFVNATRSERPLAS